MTRTGWWVFLALSVSSVSAQQSVDTMPSMSGMVSTIHTVDGSQNPELIPDAVAYRLFFTAMSEAPNASSDRRARQRAFIAPIGMSTLDQQAAISILANFKVQFAAMVAQFNAAEEAAQTLGTPSSGAAFLAQRDAMVQDTRNRLKSVLSADGMSKLDAKVQDEKKKMKIQGGQGQ